MASEPVVLFVDDEKGIRNLVKLELTSQGFQVLLADSAEQARQVIAGSHVDIILLDLLMPGESGLEFMRKQIQLSDTPIIIVSARARDIDIIRGLDLGADDYVKKPFNPDELGARIRAVLRRGRREKVVSSI